jgi:hypothetical protein
MEDQELDKRFDEIGDRLDELAKLIKKSGAEVEATFKFIGEIKSHYTLDLSEPRPFGVKVGDRVSYGGRLGTVTMVGTSATGLQANVMFDGEAEPAPRLVGSLTRVEEEQKT